MTLFFRGVALGALGLIAVTLAFPAVAADHMTGLRAQDAYAQLVAEVSGGPRIAQNACYSICRYKDSAGTEFTGTSEQGCGQACVEASDKCDKQGQGNCAKLSCEAPDNCDSPPQL